MWREEAFACSALSCLRHVDEISADQTWTSPQSATGFTVAVAFRICAFIVLVMVVAAAHPRMVETR